MPHSYGIGESLIEKVEDVHMPEGGGRASCGNDGNMFHPFLSSGKQPKCDILVSKLLRLFVVSDSVSKKSWNLYRLDFGSGHTHCKQHMNSNNISIRVTKYYISVC